MESSISTIWIKPTFPIPVGTTAHDRYRFWERQLGGSVFSQRKSLRIRYPLQYLYLSPHRNPVVEQVNFRWIGGHANHLAAQLFVDTG